MTRTEAFIQNANAPAGDKTTADLSTTEGQTMNHEHINEQLGDLYKRWWAEVSALKLPGNGGSFTGDCFSAPQLSKVNADWSTAKKRILVVGEEVRGTFFKSEFAPDNLSGVMGKCRDFFDGYIAPEYRSRSPFERTVRRLHENLPEAAFALSECDKIAYVREKGNGSLGPKYRECLHSVSIKVLAREIEFMQPTHVVFLGWHGLSVRLGLPAVYTTAVVSALHAGAPLYSLEKYPGFDPEIYPLVSVADDRCYIFAYHPRVRLQKGGNFQQDYLNPIVKALNNG